MEKNGLFLTQTYHDVIFTNFDDVMDDIVREIGKDTYTKFRKSLTLFVLCHPARKHWLAQRKKLKRAFHNSLVILLELADKIFPTTTLPEFILVAEFKNGHDIERLYLEQLDSEYGTISGEDKYPYRTFIGSSFNNERGPSSYVSNLEGLRTFGNDVTNVGLASATRQIRTFTLKLQKVRKDYQACLK